MDKQIIKTTTPKIEAFSIETILTKAIEEKVPIETMEKLLAMRRELKAEWAKEQFDEAMANFQKECPIIEKVEKVDFTSKRTGSRTTYKYAPLDEIVKQTKEIIAKNGLSYTIETENTETAIKSIVTVKHKAGHNEKTHFEVPIDKESYMNAQQQYGSASTFSKRYAFCNAFGILTGDDDNDAVDASDIKNNKQSLTPTKTYKVNGAPTPPYEQKNPRPASEPQRILIKRLVKDKQTPADIVEKVGKNLKEYNMGTAKEVIDYLLKLPNRQYSNETAPRQTTGFGAPADEIPVIDVEADEEINVDEIPF